MNTIHLNNIIGLREAYPELPIGFSDHSHGVEMAVAAVALGAALIEKHLTLDRTKIGMDNQMATEPEEMAQMVRCCLNTQTALGNKERVVRQAEQEQMEKMRVDMEVKMAAWNKAFEEKQKQEENEVTDDG